MRVGYDNECVAWIHHDKSFEFLPLPIYWKDGYQMAQINYSRRRRGFKGEHEFVHFWKPPSKEEQTEVWLKFKAIQPLIVEYGQPVI